MQGDHSRGDAAEAEGSGDVFTTHFVFEEAGDGQRGAAGAGLQRETVVEVAGFGDDVSAVAGDKQFARVGGHAGGICADFRRIADGIHLHDVVHLVLRDAVWRGREVFDGFGQKDDFVCVFGVGHGIAKRAADALSVLAIGVAEAVADGDAEEGDVDMQFAAFHEVDAATVRVDLHGFFEDARRDGIGEFAAQAGGVEFADHAVFDVLNQGRVHTGQ